MQSSPQYQARTFESRSLHLASAPLAAAASMLVIAAGDALYYGLCFMAIRHGWHLPVPRPYDC